MGNTSPNPYRRTLARAGTSWVVVIRMFTQFFLKEEKTLVKAHLWPVVLTATLGSLLSFPKSHVACSAFQRAMCFVVLLSRGSLGQDFDLWFLSGFAFCFKQTFSGRNAILRAQSYYGDLTNNRCCSRKVPKGAQEWSSCSLTLIPSYL